MKFRCRTKELAQAIGVVSRAINTQQTIPILGNVLLILNGKRCTLSATNLEFSIITSIEAEVENEGELTVPTKTLQNLAQHTLHDTLLFESAEATQLKCSSPKTRTLIMGEAASEYPTITPIQRDISFTIPEREFIQALHLTTFCSARTTTRPVLSGVCLQGNEGLLTIVATDSYRLSEYHLPLSGIRTPFTCIIPTHVLEEVKSIAGPVTKGEGEKQRTIAVALSPQQVEICIGGTTLLSRLIDGKFPDYKQILPKKHSSTVTVPLLELTSAVRRMHYFAKEVNNSITFSLSGKSLHLQTQKTQLGADESTLSIEVAGGDAKIALSSPYLLDFLGRLQGDVVVLDIIDATHPAVFRSPLITNYLHLIMPLRLVEA